MHTRLRRWLCAFAMAVALLPALASGQQLGTEQLDQLTAPVALYPAAGSGWQHSSPIQA